MEANIKEVFASIQGEGPYIGFKQLFIRFCECNLRCQYCDTDYDTAQAAKYSVKGLLKLVNLNKDCHSVSLTGGEPLISIEFLKEFLPECPLPVYLETNGTLYKNLAKIIDYVTYVAADIKLPSCTGLKPLWDLHDNFFKIAAQKELFAKAVFNNLITEEEIVKACNLCKKYEIELVLQPEMKEDKSSVNSEFIEEVLNKALDNYHNVRLIPQVHKFINVR